MNLLRIACDVLMDEWKYSPYLHSARKRFKRIFG